MIIERHPVDAGIMNSGAGREVRRFRSLGMCRLCDLTQNRTGKAPLVTVRTVCAPNDMTLQPSLDITVQLSSTDDDVNV